MKLLVLPFLLFCLSSKAQLNSIAMATPLPSNHGKTFINEKIISPDIKIDRVKWKMDKNKFITGGLLLTAGMAKGFNEALQYKYNGFEAIFPHADDQWFYPTFSYTNKYKDNDPSKGPKFPLSTSLLVMFTDQYHLNNFIQKSALTAALVFKIGEGKKPFRHYVMDILYYSACYLAGFQKRASIASAFFANAIFSACCSRMNEFSSSFPNTLSISAPVSYTILRKGLV